jgi:hypothetical protein
MNPLINYNITDSLTVKVVSWFLDSFNYVGSVMGIVDRIGAESTIVYTTSGNGIANVDTLTIKPALDPIVTRNYYTKTVGANKANCDIASVNRILVNDVNVIGHTVEGIQATGRSTHYTDARGYVLGDQIKVYDEDEEKDVWQYVSLDTRLAEKMVLGPDIIAIGTRERAISNPGTIATACHRTLPITWAVNDFLQIGYGNSAELVKIVTRVESTDSGGNTVLVAITVTRGHTEGDYDEVKRNHKEGTPICYLGPYDPSFGFNQAKFPVNYDFYTLMNTATKPAAVLVGREQFTVNSVGTSSLGWYIIGERSRDLLKDRPRENKVYSHGVDSPIVHLGVESDSNSWHSVDNPKTDSSIDKYGISSKTINGGRGTTRDGLDIYAEHVLKSYAEPKYYVEILDKDPVAFLNTLTNNRIIGLTISLTDETNGFNELPLRITGYELMDDGLYGYSIRLEAASLNAGETAVSTAFLPKDLFSSVISTVSDVAGGAMRLVDNFSIKQDSWDGETIKTYVDEHGGNIWQRDSLSTEITPINDGDRLYLKGDSGSDTVYFYFDDSEDSGMLGSTSGLFILADGDINIESSGSTWITLEGGAGIELISINSHIIFDSDDDLLFKTRGSEVGRYDRGDKEWQFNCGADISTYGYLYIEHSTSEQTYSIVASKQNLSLRTDGVYSILLESLSDVNVMLGDKVGGKGFYIANSDEAVVCLIDSLGNIVAKGTISSGTQNSVQGVVVASGSSTVSGYLVSHSSGSSPHYSVLLHVHGDGMYLYSSDDSIVLQPNNKIVTAICHIRPNADITYDLGTSTLAWRDVFADDFVTVTHYKTFDKPSNLVKKIKSKDRLIPLKTESDEDENEIWDYDTLPDWVMKKGNKSKKNKIKVPKPIELNIKTGESKEPESEEVEYEEKDALCVNRLQVLLLQSLQDIITRVEKLEGKK